MQLVHALHASEATYPKKVTSFSEDDDDLEIKLIGSKVKQFIDNITYSNFYSFTCMKYWNYFVQDLNSEIVPVTKFTDGGHFNIKLIDSKVRPM